jgi:glycine/D-amino acid oxidase-like deaminating enzyme
VIDIAVDQPMVMELRADAEHLHSLGQDVELLDEQAMRAEVCSPTYRGGLWRRDRAALVDPARLVWGLKAAAESLGVRIYEDTKVTSIEHDGVGIMATTPLGRVRSGKVALGTNAFPPLLRRMKHYVAPVYDYALTTEPLTAEQRASVGWVRRQGLSDMGNQFHYYRLTEDDRILWGGYDAIYYFGGKVTKELEQRPETWAKLAEHFFATFPQLTGVQFSHAWGGVIDTSTRFCQFWDTAMKGKVTYCLGYTGLGVAAARFGAEVMLDLLDGRRSEAASLEFVRKKPLPFPPEPIRYAGIQATRWSIDRADRNGGHRNLWLRGLDRLGLGFDS